MKYPNTKTTYCSPQTVLVINCLVEELIDNFLNCFRQHSAEVVVKCEADQTKS